MSMTTSRQNCPVPPGPAAPALFARGAEERLPCGGRAAPTPPSDDSFYEDGDDRRGACKNSDREARKKAEKQRRTVLNGHIGELAGLVSLVASAARKVDKTSVLRLAAHDLRQEHVFGDTARCHLDTSAGACDAFLELAGGFLLATTTGGVMLVASANVRDHLGHAQLDLLGQNVLSITHPEDAAIMRRNLTPSAVPGAPGAPEPAPERRDFTVRLARAAARAEAPQYALCRVDGSFRRADRAGLAPEGHLVRRQRVRRDRAVSPSGNDAVFIGLVRVLRPPALSARLLEASKSEYWTRHLVDGRIVHCDQRISLVAGYMSEEVTGVSAFTFMHKEDVRWVIIALRQMYDENKPYGESCYRLISRTGQFMYLRTKGFLEIDSSTKAAQSFVCINSLVSDSDGARLIADMKRKYSALIDLDETDAALRCGGRDGAMSVEDPRQLEQVIMHLVTNLPSPAPGPLGSPPSEGELTIIPPQPSTIKPSIEKSLPLVALGKRGAPPSPSAPGPRRRPAPCCLDYG